MEESAPLLTSIHTSITTWFTPTILFIFLNLMIATILFTSNLPNNKQQLPKPNQKPETQNDAVQSKLARSPSIYHRLKSFTSYPHGSQDEPSPVTNQHEQQQQQSLELAATQYVFNHPFTHEQDLQPVSPNPNNFDLKFNPTRFDSDSDFKQTNAVQLANVQTHFVFDKHTVEKVTTHFDFGSDCIETETRPEEDTDENDDLESLDEVYSKITGGHVNRTKSDTQPASGEVPVKLPAKMKKSASLKSAFSHFEEEKVVEARRPATVRERRVAEDDDVEVDSKADDFINKFKHQLKLQRMDSIIRYKDMVNRGGGK